MYCNKSSFVTQLSGTCHFRQMAMGVTWLCCDLYGAHLLARIVAAELNGVFVVSCLQEKKGDSLQMLLVSCALGRACMYECLL